jgi:hypothetical protein
MLWQIPHDRVQMSVRGTNGNFGSDPGTRGREDAV